MGGKRERDQQNQGQNSLCVQRPARHAHFKSSCGGRRVRPNARLAIFKPSPFPGLSVGVAGCAFKRKNADKRQLISNLIAGKTGTGG
jgi:hypothetical protein